MSDSSTPNIFPISTRSKDRYTVIGSFQGLVATALCLPTGFLTAAFLTRKLGPENYGSFTVAVAIVVWIEIMITIGFNRTTIKMVAGESDWKTLSAKLVQVQFMTGLIAAALLLAGAPLLASLLDAPELSYSLRLFALDIPIHALGNIHQAILIGRGHFSYRAFLTALYWISRLIFIFLIVGFSPSINSAILASIGATLMVFIGARIYVRPKILKRLKGSFVHLWDYAWPLFFYTLAMHLFNRLDLLFVKAISEVPASAGFFGAAKNLTIVPGIFTASLSPLLLAKLSLLMKMDQQEQAQLITRDVMRLVFCLVPFAGMITGASHELVTTIYGRPFSPAAPLLALLIFSAIGVCMISLIAIVLVAAERPQLPFYLITPLLGLTFVAHYIIVPLFGAVGAASVTTILAWIGAIAVMIAVYKIRKVYLPFSTVGRSICVSVLAYVTASIWPAQGIYLFLKLMVITIIIILALLLCGEFTTREIASARSMLHRRDVR